MTLTHLRQRPHRVGSCENAHEAFAYVVTRPLGASFADWLAVTHERGGLALGTGPVSLVLAAMIAAIVAYLTVTRKDVPELR